jgi:hypothetical protein
MMDTGHRIIIHKLDTSRVTLIENIPLGYKLGEYRKLLLTLLIQEEAVENNNGFGILKGPFNGLQSLWMHNIIGVHKGYYIRL